jgi:hypothetical protein
MGGQIKTLESKKRGHLPVGGQSLDFKINTIISYNRIQPDCRESLQF